MYYPLLPLAFIYDVVTSVRNLMYDHGILSSESYDVPVICVGNITVGGTGKTPHTEYLVRLLQHFGYKVAILSRGYKRLTRGLVLATETSTAEDIGDEALQMAQKFPDAVVAVDENRREGIRRLIAMAESPIDVILLDDAFQHRRVSAGLNIVLMDVNRPIDKDYLLPAGRLRENKRGLKRANMVIVTKHEHEPDEAVALRYSQKLALQDDCDLFFTRFKYGNLRGMGMETTLCLDQLSDYQVLLVTGIANPEPLKKELSRYVSFELLQFGDHHRFTARDYQIINHRFEQMSDDHPRILLTTEKDAARLNRNLINHPEALFVLPVEVEFLRNKQMEFNKKILAYVRENSRNGIILNE